MLDAANPPKYVLKRGDGPPILYADKQVMRPEEIANALNQYASVMREAEKAFSDSDAWQEIKCEHDFKHTLLTVVTRKQLRLLLEQWAWYAPSGVTVSASQPKRRIVDDAEQSDSQPPIPQEVLAVDVLLMQIKASGTAGIKHYLVIETHYKDHALSIAQRRDKLLAKMKQQNLGVPPMLKNHHYFEWVKAAEDELILRLTLIKRKV